MNRKPSDSVCLLDERVTVNKAEAAFNAVTAAA
jgi:hypothetical protein